MAKVWCCRRYQQSNIFKITPTRENILEEFVLYLDRCNFCERQALELLRVDINGKILKPLRIKTKNIEKFLENMNIIWKPKKINFNLSYFPKFVLHYNEYGTKKTCKQNLSNLKLGQIDTNPLAGLTSF